MTAESATLPALPCACASLRRAARAVSQLYDEQFRGTGLRVTQFTLLQVLARGGELMQGELGDLLAIDSTTLTRTLGPLERAGWIRARSGDDRRTRYWSLTAAGKQRLTAAQSAWESAQNRLRRRLGNERWSSLLSDLTHVAEAARH